MMLEKPYHHGNLPKALIEAVISLVREKGVTSLTMREVSRRAGVSHNAPYAHYADMESLLAAVAESGFLMIHGIMQETAQKKFDNPIKKLETLCIQYVRFSIEHRDFYRIMFGPQIANPLEHEHLTAAAFRVLQLVTDAIQECQKLGQLKPDEPSNIAIVAWSTMHGLASLLAERRIPVDDLDQVNELVILATTRLYFGLAVEQPVDKGPERP